MSFASFALRPAIRTTIAIMPRPHDPKVPAAKPILILNPILHKLQKPSTLCTVLDSEKNLTIFHEYRLLPNVFDLFLLDRFNYEYIFI